VVVVFIRLGPPHARAEPPSGTRGLPVVAVGRTITAEDVRSLDDDE
jgi:hypothetical protein